ncbi:oligosaccharide flippase family protein [Rhodobacteraceae bacterium KN286]|uniref:Oligosaccharide flippase family protein n=2 Tax=Oceanomicrobium pacificus TaxID=2692916 RepID=A0A6B0TPS0_9RHOB|nr:oligosaccharide flippase family protein [Oceanomicrobium pacificus]
MISIGILFGQAVLTARLLGPEGYGTLAFGLSVATVAATVATLGLGKLAVRQIAFLQVRGDPQTLAKFLGSALSSTLVSAIVVSALIAVTFLGSDIVDDDIRAVSVLSAILVTPIAVLLFLRGVSQGHQNVLLSQGPIDVLRPALVSLVILAMLASGRQFGPISVLLASATVLLLVALSTFLMMKSKGLIGWPGKVEVSDIRLALPFAGLSILAILQIELNTILLASLAGAEAAGLYQPIARIAPLILIGVQAVGMRYAPRIAACHSRGDNEQLRKLTRYFTVATTVVTAVLGILIAGSGPILLLVFGKAFVTSASFLWLVVAAQVFSAACGPVAILLTMTGATKTALAGQFVALLVHLLVGFLLIPDMGVAGAVWALVAGIAASNLFLYAAVRSQLRFDPSVLQFMVRQK